MGYAVLFVDDDFRVTAGLKRILRKEPYQILTANSAEEAIEILKGRRVDVVVADYRMPVMTGISLLCYVRDTYPSTARMMLTGRGDMKTAVSAVNEAGVVRFFTKPCNEVELGLAIREVLKGSELQASANGMVELVEMQAAYIRHLEHEHPGISDVIRESDGSIRIESEDEGEGP